MHEDDQEITKVPELIVGKQSLIDWLASIGITASVFLIDCTRRRHGIPTFRDNTLYRSIYPRDVLKRYVKAIVGVPLSCWLAERDSEKKRGEVVLSRRPMFGSLVVKNLGFLYAVVSPIVYSRGSMSGSYEQVLAVDGKMMMTRDEETASLWDCSALAVPWRVYRYANVMGSTMEAAKQPRMKWRFGRQATMLMIAYRIDPISGHAGPCKIPAPLIGYERDEMLPAVIPPSLPSRAAAVEYVERNCPGAWLWCWRNVCEVKPVTLSPTATKFRGTHQARRCKNPGKNVEAQVIDVEGMIPIDGDNSIDADVLLEDGE